MDVIGTIQFNETISSDKCALKQGSTPNKGPDREDDTEDGTVYYHIQPYTTGDDCDTTAQEKTIKNAFVAAGNFLHDAGATAGCCTFQHGDGTWHSHVKVKTGAKFPWNDPTFVCPPSAHALAE